MSHPTQQPAASSEVPANGPAASWVAEAQRKLDQLRRLPRGWDSHDGLPLQPEIGTAAQHVLDRLRDQDLPIPAVVLGSGGTVQLEWRQGGKELELEIEGPDSCTFLRVYPDGHMEEGTIQDDLASGVRRLTRWLMER